MNPVDEELIELIMTRYIPPIRPQYVDIEKPKHRDWIIAEPAIKKIMGE